MTIPKNDRNTEISNALDVISSAADFFGDEGYKLYAILIAARDAEFEQYINALKSPDGYTSLYNLNLAIMLELISSRAKDDLSLQECLHAQYQYRYGNYLEHKSRIKDQYENPAIRHNNGCHIQ